MPSQRVVVSLRRAVDAVDGVFVRHEKPVPHRRVREVVEKWEHAFLESITGGRIRGRIRDGTIEVATPVGGGYFVWRFEDVLPLVEQVGVGSAREWGRIVTGDECYRRVLADIISPRVGHAEVLEAEMKGGT